MRKKAVVYDKWLSSLGGGEVVACSIARVLNDHNYDVIFVSGKKTNSKDVQEKLKINLNKINFKQIWNDEIALKKICQGKDLFVNCSFMDYSGGYAKKNIYYTLFPSKIGGSIQTQIMLKFILPWLSKIINPFEMDDKSHQVYLKGLGSAYQLVNYNEIAITNLFGKEKIIEFEIVYENYSYSILNNFTYEFRDANIISQEVLVNPRNNVIRFKVRVRAYSNTAYLILNFKKDLLRNGKTYLLYPSIRLWDISEPIYNFLYKKIMDRLRAGVFSNISQQLSNYQTIIADSSFTQKWIKNYWQENSTIIYPPVQLLNHKHPRLKQNMICSIGRFFTLGHGKKQEVLIEAFKKFYNKGNKKWQFHLVGGLGNEESSLEFVNLLIKEANGYPIFFHFNASKKEVEDIYLKSKIYWHATGYGENENQNPIKFEHFGISPIEAISAKCIPILFNGGGLKETIDILGFDRNLCTFNTVDQLINNTIQLSKENINFNWDQIFSKIEKNYSEKAFENNLLEMIS